MLLLLRLPPGFLSLVAISCTLADSPGFSGRLPNLGDPIAKRTINLSGFRATDGDNRTNEEAFKLLTLYILDGFNIYRVKQYNDRLYLNKFLRSYWLGERYYQLDNNYYFATRDTCKYMLNATEKQHLFYEEDGEQIDSVIYQCQRYAQWCCGMDCCQDEGVHSPQRPMKYPWSDPNRASVFFVSLLLLLLSPFIIVSRGL